MTDMIIKNKSYLGKFLNFQGKGKSYKLLEKNNFKGGKIKLGFLDTGLFI